MTTSERPGSPTLEEVAAAAGVSRSTVSRVVNGSPKVSPAARTAVEHAITELGYVPNRAARSLVTRRSGSLALVVTEPDTRVFSEPFFAGIIRGVSSEIARTELQLVLLMAVGEERRDRLQRFLFGGHADGAILLSLHGQDPLPQHLLERRLPTVMGGRPPEGTEMSYVDADNIDGTRAATSHLLAHGRQRIATITGPLDMTVGRDRLAGYRRALWEAARPADAALEQAGDFTQEGGRAAMRRLLERCPDLDGVVAASDLAAVGAIQVLREAGRRVPDDVAVVGFDDSAVARSADPPLTSVRQPVEDMGRHMVRLLLAEVEDSQRDGPRQIVLPTELVVRASS